MTEQEQDDLVATEIMGWRLYVGDGVDYWDPRTRWDHAGMLFDKLIADGYSIETDTSERACEVLLYHANPDKVARVVRATSAFPATLFAAALATLEKDK